MGADGIDAPESDRLRQPPRLVPGDVPQPVPVQRLWQDPGEACK